MRKNKITYLVAFLFLAIGISSCSSSSKHIPDFTGVYKGVIEEPEFLFWNNAAKVYLRKNSNDPYRLSLKTNLYKESMGDPFVMEFDDVLVDSRSATDNTFKFKGKEIEVDFGVDGKAKVSLDGVTEGNVMTLNYKITSSHKGETYTATFYGPKMNKKESSKAEIEEFIINDVSVRNIELIGDDIYEISIQRMTSIEVIKGYKFKIKVSDGARYKMEPSTLDIDTPAKAMTITVVSEDESVEQVYTVRLKYV
ncbi:MULTISPECIES: hypothetical protein [Bacteroides]|uniref:hypothetical protein n=1 Tax=Bacteroides TaxID=816 RepID=UPI001D8ADD6C|nr:MULTISPECIES: hypothetical protein [Bacteroides]HJD92927.1 hypothetical protein [Bacteroides coprosuis]